MGNKQSNNVSAPYTHKISKNGSSEGFSYGMCEMQGWRHYMVSLKLYRKMSPLFI